MELSFRQQQASADAIHVYACQVSEAICVPVRTTTYLVRTIYFLPGTWYTVVSTQNINERYFCYYSCDACCCCCILVRISPDFVDYRWVTAAAVVGCLGLTHLFPGSRNFNVCLRFHVATCPLLPAKGCPASGKTPATTYDKHSSTICPTKYLNLSHSL